VDSIPVADDPGVASVKQIYTYYKKFGYKTIGEIFFLHLIFLFNLSFSDGS